MKIVKDVWKKQDKDKNGVLSKKEARNFVTHTLKDLGNPVTIDESKFQNLYKECDKNKTGNLSKKEFMVFVGKLILAK